MGLSLPVRGAWIEIAGAAKNRQRIRRSPCGERGLKLALGVILVLLGACRSPCGERGLK